MRRLYLGNGGNEFKFADTTTEIRLSALDDVSPASLSQNTKVRIKNDSGYLMDANATVDGNQATITSGQLAQLPPGRYLLELWDNTTDGGTAIYPSDGFLAIQINENAVGLSGEIISSMTVDDFTQKFGDLSQQLKKEVADSVANGELGNEIRTQVDNLNKINYVEFKNYVGEDVFEEGKYWTTSANKIIKVTGPNVALCPKIRIKANTRYSIRRVTSQFCYLGTDDDVLISKLSAYAGLTSFTYGGETCYSLITDTDCWLYMTFQSNLNYKTITVVEGNLPAKYYKYGVVFRKEINGVPIGGAWHEKIVVDKSGSGDYSDLNTAMNYVDRKSVV